MTNTLITLGRLAFDATDDATVADGVRALVTPTFTFRQEGYRTGADELISHLCDTRKATRSGDVIVLDELVDHRTHPVRIASRILFRLEWTDGTTDELESQMIGVLVGGRLDVLHEAGRFLRPGDDRPSLTRRGAHRERRPEPFRLDRAAAAPRPGTPRHAART